MPFSKQLSALQQLPYNLLVKREQFQQKELIEIIQDPLKESQIIYNLQAIQQNKRTILESIKNTEDIILNSKRFLETIPAFNCQKIKNHSPDGTDSENRQSLKKELKQIQNPYHFFNTSHNRNDGLAFQYQRKNQYFFKERDNQQKKYNETIKKASNYYLDDQQKFGFRQGNKFYGSFTPRANLSITGFQKQENYTRTPASTSNKLDEQIKYFKKKVKILENIDQNEALQKQQIKKQLFPVQRNQNIKKTFHNKYSQKFNQQVNLYMENNLQINLNYHQNQRQKDKQKIQEKKELYYKHLKLQSVQNCPSKQGHVKKAISPFINLKNKSDAQTKNKSDAQTRQIQISLKKTFINKPIIGSKSQMQSPRQNNNKQYLNSTLTSPKIKNSQFNIKDKTFNAILIKDNNLHQKQKTNYIQKQRQKTRFIEKQKQANIESNSQNKFQDQKKTLSQKINQQLSKLQKLNSVQRELGKLRMKQRSLASIQRQKSKQKLNYHRLKNNSKNQLTLQNSVQSKEQSPTKSGRKRKLIFEKSTPKQQKQKHLITKKKQKSSPQKNRIQKLYENQVNSHNQTIQSKIYQFIVQQESKSNRSIQKKRKAVNYNRNYNRNRSKNQSPTNNILTSSKLSNSRQSLGKCPYHGNKSNRKEQLYSSLDKRKVQQILREELQINQENIVKSSPRFTKLQECQIREQIKKIKDYEFIERYFNNYQLEQILKDFIHRSIPCRKWSLLIIDEVYKKIRVRQQLDRQ